MEFAQTTYFSLWFLVKSEGIPSDEISATRNTAA
jgi:hypothetical protein